MKSYVVRPVLCVFLVLCGCVATVTDERLASRTASFLGVYPSDITISNRRSDGDIIYYDAHVRRGESVGRIYPCSYTERRSGVDLIVYSNIRETSDIGCDLR